MNLPGKIILPFYAKMTIILIGIFVLFAMLYIGRMIIVPLVFSMIMAIVLHPVVNFFVKRKINRVIAIILTLTFTVIIIGAFGTFIFSQISIFTESAPELIDKFTVTLNEIIVYASGYFDIDPDKIHEWVTNTQNDILNSSTAAIGQTLSTLTGILVAVFLVPVYIFLILFYEPLLLDFVRKLFGEDKQSKVGAVVSKTKTLIQHYLVGLVIEIAIIAVLEISALLIFGIQYAFLIGILGALLNTIPYIGAFIAALMPMMVALVTKSPMVAVYIMITYYAIQLIDNNFIVPKIVASQVKVNALFSIFVVIAGNALWGIPGMFLAIPSLAIVKLFFDNIDGMKPWGFLLGDTMPSILEIKPIFKKIKKQAK